MTEEIKYGPGRPKKGEVRAPKVKRPNRHGKGVPRPHMWLIGPDDSYKHSMYLPWLRAKAQANFRQEGWTLTFEEFYNIWEKEWPNRGRGSDQMCMSRLDFEKEWTADNCVVIIRSEHLKQQGQYRKELNMKYRTGNSVRFDKMKLVI